MACASELSPRAALRHGDTAMGDDRLCRKHRAPRYGSDAPAQATVDLSA
jgi:hypothetical protein